MQLLPAEESVEVPPSDATSSGALSGTPVWPCAGCMRAALRARLPVDSADPPVLGEQWHRPRSSPRAAHEHSPRRQGPFVVFDCGAGPPSRSSESELFGSKRGAFTGAHADRPGAFALADKGTLFLDEIGDLPLSLQPKLLRLLERGEVTPLGARKSEHYDVRFVGRDATGQILGSEVSAGDFPAATSSTVSPSSR